MSDRKPAVAATARSNSKSRLLIGVVVALGVVVSVALFRMDGFLLGARDRAFVRTFTPGPRITGGYVGWVGAKIKVGADPVTVTSLGRIAIAENARTHTLKIVNEASGEDVPSSAVEVSMAGQPAGKFVYGSLRPSVTLLPGASYYLVSSESLGTNVGDFFNDHNSKVVTTMVAKVEHAIYKEGDKWRALGTENEMFGPLDFKYRR